MEPHRQKIPPSNAFTFSLLLCQPRFKNAILFSDVFHCNHGVTFLSNLLSMQLLFQSVFSLAFHCNHYHTVFIRTVSLQASSQRTHHVKMT